MINRINLFLHWAMYRPDSNHNRVGPIYGLLLAILFSQFYGFHNQATSARQKDTGAIASQIKDIVQPGGKVYQLNQKASSAFLDKLLFCQNQDIQAAIHGYPTPTECEGTP